MENSKFILKSKTIWGVLIAAVPTILAQFGYDMGNPELLNGIVNEIFEVVGAVLAVFGRIVAEGPIAIKPKL